MVLLPPLLNLRIVVSLIQLKTADIQLENVPEYNLFQMIFVLEVFHYNHNIKLLEMLYLRC